MRYALDTHMVLTPSWLLPGCPMLPRCPRELYVADHEGMDKGHYFHAMWHFSMDDLLQKEEGGVARLEAAGWALEMQPRTAADLALERYARHLCGHLWWCRMHLHSACGRLMAC